MAQRVGRQVLIPRATRAGGLGGGIARAVIAVLPEPATQAQDLVELSGVLGDGGLRLVEQGEGLARRAGPGMRERAPVQQVGIARKVGQRLAKGITGVPRRTVFEMPADALAGGARGVGL